MDSALFQAINHLAGSNAAVDGFFIFISTYGPYVLFGLLVVLWFGSRQNPMSAYRQRMVIIAILSVMLALLINQVIIRVWARPRPFTILATNLLLPPSREPSFPSDHATFGFAIALALLLASRPLGISGSLIAILLAFSRVYTGEHYPSDVIAGAVIGGITTLLLFRAQSYLEPTLGPILHFARRLRLA